MVIKAPAGPVAERSVVATILEVGGEYQFEAVLLFPDFNRSATADGLKRYCVPKDAHVPVFVARYFFGGARLAPNQSFVGPGWFADPPSPAYTRMQLNETQCSFPKSDVPLVERYSGGPNYSLLGVKHAINNYVFGHYNMRTKKVEEAAMYRRHIDSICVAGGSHARDLAAEFVNGVWVGARFAGESFFDPAYKILTVGTVRLGDPSDVLSSKTIPQTTLRNFNLRSCSHLILHFGQWDAGWPCRACVTAADRAHHVERHCSLTPGEKGCPPQFATFERDLEDRLDEFEKAGLKHKLIMVTSNYNGLTCGMRVCPIFDFRVLPALETINEIMEKVAQRHGVPFLNTEDIVHPIWDHSVDLGHPSGAVKAALVTRWTDYLCDTLGSTACQGPKLPRLVFPGHPPANEWWRI